jgi:hypothetical protein
MSRRSAASATSVGQSRRVRFGLAVEVPNPGRSIAMTRTGRLLYSSLGLASSNSWRLVGKPWK